MTSTSSTTLTHELTPQAGPIPSKRGEIGFIEGVHEQVQEPSQMVDQAPLPARHPADSRVPTPFQEAHSHLDTSQTLPNDNSMTNVRKRPFLGHEGLPKFMGIHFRTLALLGAQLLLFAGTLTGWVFAAIALSSSGTPKGPPPGPVNNNNTPQDGSGDDSGAPRISVHIIFVIVALTQVVLIERRICRVRAERYAFKHPDEVLPTLLQRGHLRLNSSMPVAPWSRPPLPTYTAAVASSGAGTGDVEDAQIARPPPPAYGKIRGNMLVLASYLRDSLRVQVREHEHDRPISFVSRDEEWEVRRDAERARRVEEALAAQGDS